MDFGGSKKEEPVAHAAAISLFRIAVPAWNWGRSMVGLKSAEPALSRDELQRIFQQDLAQGRFGQRASDRKLSPRA